MYTLTEDEIANIGTFTNIGTVALSVMTCAFGLALGFVRDLFVPSPGFHAWFLVILLAVIVIGSGSTLRWAQRNRENWRKDGAQDEAQINQNKTPGRMFT